MRGSTPLRRGPRRAGGHLDRHPARHLAALDTAPQRAHGKVIRALDYQRKRFPRRTRIGEVLRYFRRNRHRMRYADTQARHLPIGSGVVEATCKTLVTQRLKRSGMRWRRAGGQAILTLRALIQSSRFDQAWALLSETYRQEVIVPDNVVAVSLQTCRMTNQCQSYTQRPARRATWARDAMSDAPAVLRALCESPETQAMGVGLSVERPDPPTTPEAVAQPLEERATEHIGTEHTQ